MDKTNRTFVLTKIEELKATLAELESYMARQFPRYFVAAKERVKDLWKHEKTLVVRLDSEHNGRNIDLKGKEQAYNSFHNLSRCERQIKIGNWMEITVAEAEKMIVDAQEKVFPRYFIPKSENWNKEYLLRINSDKMGDSDIYSVNRELRHDGSSLVNALPLVAAGNWREISKEEAEQLIAEKTSRFFVPISDWDSTALMVRATSKIYEVLYADHSNVDTWISDPLRYCNQRVEESLWKEITITEANKLFNNQALRSFSDYYREEWFCSIPYKPEWFLRNF